jgi:DNA-binding LytR/AlgR family response regulator
LKIHTTEKTITTRETISNIETKLPPKNFLRCHRSIIVSISKIDSFTNEYIEVCKTAISISRSYRSAVLEKQGSFKT